jgi:Cu/Ag efflux protein CusF
MRRRAEWTRKIVISMRNMQIENHTVIAMVFKVNDKNCLSSLKEMF